MEGVVDIKYRPALFLNGGAGAPAAAKKMRPSSAAAWGAAGEPGVYVYRECLKNHAASMGGHALDGCGEFMPSPEADPADPGSLRCAACGCHRNFHRRLPEAPPTPALLALPPPPPPVQAPAPAVAPHVMRDARAVRGEETPAEDRVPAAYDDETEDESESSDFEEDRPVSPLPPVMGPAGYHQSPPPPPGYLQSQPPPHMLLGLSTGAPGAASVTTTPAAAAAPTPAVSLGAVPSAGAAAAAAAMAKKRFRTRFSPEQKQRMQALSERLGWRLQKRDEAVVEESCREIGVTKSVFKVWMHNNKHNFVGGHSARRSAAAAAVLPSPHAAAYVHAFPSPHAAAVHPPPAPAAPPAAPAPPPPAPAPVHTDFNINGAAAAAGDYFRVVPATASGGSPQSS